MRERLPDERASWTQHFRIWSAEYGETDVYVTVGLYPNGKPGEVFVRLGRESSTLSRVIDAWAGAISIGLQYGIPIDVFIEKWKATQYEPRGFCDLPEIKSCSSVLDGICRWLEKKFVSETPSEQYYATNESLPPKEEPHEHRSLERVG